LEIIAGAFTIGYWNPDLTKSIFVAIFLFAIVVINLFGVKTYGEAEFIFSLIKITAIVGFMYVNSPPVDPNTDGPDYSPSS
jgi:yeast amino acid transporter